MNTNTVTLMELSAAPSNWSKFDKKLRAAAVQVEIANRAIKALSSGIRMRAGEIAKVIGDAGVDWRGEPCEVGAQQVGTVMRKLVKIGRAKREEVTGDPMEITIQGRYHYDYNKGERTQDEPRKKTITPTIAYYSLL